MKCFHKWTPWKLNKQTLNETRGCWQCGTRQKRRADEERNGQGEEEITVVRSSSAAEGVFPEHR